MPKPTVLNELAESKHHYALLADLKAALIVREYDSYVSLRQPNAVLDVLESLDDYVTATAAGEDLEARDRKRHRRTAEKFLARSMLREVTTSPVPSLQPRWSDENRPGVRWISWEGGSRGRYELLDAAASFDVQSDLLTINADWRGYLELRNAVGYEVADLTLASKEEAWELAHDEWARALLSTVVARRITATQEKLMARLPYYLSDDALTAAVADRSYIFSACRTKLRKLESARRQAAKSSDAGETVGA